MSVPSNVEAEESVLGAALLSPVAFELVIAQLDPADFYKPAHGVIHGALRRMWDRGERKADPVLVGDEIIRAGDVEAIGGTSMLITLQANTPATSNAGRYIRIIQETALLRRMARAGADIANLALEEGLTGIDERLANARQMVQQLNLPDGISEPSPNVSEFLERETTQDWLVPGLIERGDRIILTAPEGHGKSTLIRQLAVQMAAGVHPWESRFFDPIRVLIVDVENSVPQVQRKLKQLVLVAGTNLHPDNLRIEVRPEGIDLTNRHDVRWLIERVATMRPDLVTIGPIYKLHSEEPKDELPARQVAQVLDTIRARYGCSLLIEAHSPHGVGGRRVLRPFGASLWMRWPEFGYGLRQTKADPNKFIFEAWRGPRDVRAWPESIRRGGEWPWTAFAKQERIF